ncbi:hypothetical protein BD779DRAFT_1497675 [Infundibulicybe gibba]|nr:hypothetical protein BD779DRAFT_1497675 [Infundibulicybe gibba]
MSKTVPRKVIVQYSDAWALDTSKPRNQIGIISSFIPASSHKTTEAGSSFSFPFQGSSLEVHGSVFGNASQAPVYDCFVDQVQIVKHNPPSTPGPWTMCDTRTINGPHTLTVNITDPGPIGLWFDYIIYEPEPQADITAGIYRIDKSDPAIVYSPGWGRFGDFANGTNVPHAQLSLNFEGQGISFLGYFAVEQPHPAAIASYSIDGGSPVNFSIDGIDGNRTSSIFDLELFGVIGLTPGNHSLKVVYLGNTKQAPLALNYFHVLGSIPGTTNNTTPPSSPTPTQQPSSSNHSTPDQPDQPAHHMPLGVIVGVLVGVSFLVSMAVGLFFFLRKRKRPLHDTEGGLLLSNSKSHKTRPSQARIDVTPFTVLSMPQNNLQVAEPSAEPIQRSWSSFARRRRVLAGGAQANRIYEKGIRRPPPAAARNISVVTERPPQYSA